MPYKFQPKRPYMMPTHFGPRPYKKGSANIGERTALSVSFLTNREQLAELLPEGFEVDGEAIVTVLSTLLRQVEWLAGRGYNFISVSCPAVYNGKEDHITDTFTLMMWENLTDPIIQGREVMGFPKLYADIPDHWFYHGEWHSSASWMGFKFLDIALKNAVRLSSEEIKAWAQKRQGGGGTIVYKYIPRAGSLEADVCYPVLISGGSTGSLCEVWRGEGAVQFYQATWEQLPTMVHVVNALHNLEIKEYREAFIAKSMNASVEVPGQKPYRPLR